MKNFEWKSEQPYYGPKPLSATTLRQLGIKREEIKMVEDLDELKQYPPNIVIGKAVKTVSFVQNQFKKQTLQKKEQYVMGLGVYQQLHMEPIRRVKVLQPGNIQFKRVYRPYRGEDLTDKTLLVFRTGGIGDLLFIQPNLRFLKEKYPTCKIYFACGPQYQAMVEAWDCIDKVLDLPFPLKYLRMADYHALFEGVIERCKLAHTVNAYNLFSQWMGLDLPDELLIPRQEPKPDKVDEVKKIVDEWGLNDGFILVQIRASSVVRTPKPSYSAKIINEAIRRGLKVVITDSPHYAQNIDEFIETFVDEKDKVFNFSKHSKTLDYSIALISLSDCVVATDSSMNHIAASLDVPCFGLFGPFPGHIRLKTYPRAKWIDANRHCTFCYLHGMNPCPEAKVDRYSPCYETIDPIKVVDGVEELVNEFCKKENNG